MKKILVGIIAIGILVGCGSNDNEVVPKVKQKKEAKVEANNQKGTIRCRMGNV